MAQFDVIYLGGGPAGYVGALRSAQLFDMKLRKPCPPDLLIGAVLGEEPGDEG